MLHMYIWVCVCVLNLSTRNCDQVRSSFYVTMICATLWPYLYIRLKWTRTRFIITLNKMDEMSYEIYWGHVWYFNTTFIEVHC